MRKFLFLTVVIVLFTSPGCSQHRLKPSAYGQAENPLKESRVFKPEKFATGGKLLVVPFSAGAGVAANDDLERVSLMIVKGIADALQEQGSRFTLVSSEGAPEADVVIKGRIVAMATKTGITKPWGKKPRRVTLSIEGSVLGVEEEDILAKFSQSKEFQGPDVRFEALAYEIGVEIGKFLTINSQ